MKNLLKNILKEYLLIYPEEQERQRRFQEFLDKNRASEVIDWNNFNGHIVTGAFIYAKKDNKFLFLYHKDLKMYLYPGGHVESKDKSPLEAAKREAREETGLSDFTILSNYSNKIVPIDIDTQFIEYNERLSLPSHYHYDFRYVLMINEVKEVKLDVSELRDYKWLDYEEVINMKRYANIRDKLVKIIATIS